MVNRCHSSPAQLAASAQASSRAVLAGPQRQLCGAEESPACPPPPRRSLALAGFNIMHVRLAALNKTTIEAYEKRPIQ